MSLSWNSALRILSRRDHSRAELERKLKLRKFDPNEIQSTLQQLESLGYLNDERVAQARVRSYLKKGYSVSGAVQKTKQIGLSDEVLRKTSKAATQEQQDSTEDPNAALKQFLELKLRGKWDDKTVSRVLRYFLARGHRFPELKIALEGLNLKWPKK